MNNYDFLVSDISSIKGIGTKTTKLFKKKNINISRIISHLGFGLLIFFIYINHIFSVENNFNLKLGETKKTEYYTIKFVNLEEQSIKNYKSIIFSLNDIVTVTPYILISIKIGIMIFYIIIIIPKI